MDWNRVCPSCMKEYQGAGELPQYCPSCGCEYGHDNGAQALPVRTILNGKYIVGKLVERRKQELVYLAYDLNLEVDIRICEFFSEQDKLSEGFEQSRQQYLESLKKRAKTEAGSIREVFTENQTVYGVMVAAHEMPEEQIFTQAGYTQTGYAQVGQTMQQVKPPANRKKRSGRKWIAVLAVVLLVGVVGIALVSSSKSRGAVDDRSLVVQSWKPENRANLLGTVYRGEKLLLAGEKNALYAMNLDGADVSDEPYLFCKLKADDRYISGVATDGEYIYTAVEDMGIYRVLASDASGRLEKITTNDSNGTFFLYGDYLFHYANNTIYRCNKDGSDNHMLCDVATGVYTVAGDGIYFGHKSENAVYHMDFDGGEQKRTIDIDALDLITPDRISGIAMTEHFLYLTQTDWDYFCIIKLATGELVNGGKVPAESAEHTISIELEYSDCIYYLCGTKGQAQLYVYDISADKSTQLTTYDAGIWGVAAQYQNCLVVMDGNMDFHVVDMRTGELSDIPYRYQN